MRNDSKIVSNGGKLTLVVHLASAVLDVLEPGRVHRSTVVAADGPLGRVSANVLERNASTAVLLGAVRPLALDDFLGGLSIHRKLIPYVVVDVLKERNDLVEPLVAVAPLAAERRLVHLDVVSPSALVVALGNVDARVQAGAVRFDAAVVRVKVHVALQLGRRRRAEVAQIPVADESCQESDLIMLVRF